MGTARVQVIKAMLYVRTIGSYVLRKKGHIDFSEPFLHFQLFLALLTMPLKTECSFPSNSLGVPSSATLPLSMTTTLSLVSIIVSRRWAIVKTVEEENSSKTVRCTRASVSGSTAAVASSY